VKVALLTQARDTSARTKIDSGVLLTSSYRIRILLFLPLRHAFHNHQTRPKDSDSSTQWLQLGRVRRSLCLGLALDVDVQLSNNAPAPAMGVRTRLFLTLPLLKGVVGFDVALYCMQPAWIPTPRLERRLCQIPIPIPVPVPVSAQFQSQCWARRRCMLHSPLVVCLYVKVHLLTSAPTSSFGRRGCCICILGTVQYLIDQVPLKLLRLCS
jgi:hypothetical protein